VKISLVKKSDYLALLFGDPKRLRLRFSDDIHEVSARLPRARDGEPRTVLLLGANGFVGMHILRELLKRDDIGKVITITRSTSKVTGIDRIRDCLRRYDMSLPSSERLEVLDGSFTEPQMSLAPSSYQRLRSSVDVLINAAGSTNHAYQYSYFRKEGVLSTLRLVEFCLEDRLKSYHCMGSMGGEVYSRYRDFLRLGFFHCGYSRMKWVNKHLVARFFQEGIPASIYLTPFVLGSQYTGYKDPGLQYSFWQMLYYAGRMGMIWDCGDRPMPIVSGDVLAKIVIDNALSTSPKNVVHPTCYVSSLDLAKNFGWQHVPWKRFRRELFKRFSLRASDVFSGLKGAIKNLLYTRALFPSYLPHVLDSVNLRSVASEDVPPNLALTPAELVSVCAQNNYMLKRTLRGAS